MTASIKARFKKTDLGMKNATSRIEDLARSHVIVGLPGENSPPAKDRDGNTTGLTVAQVGVINEFGSESAGIPARPFMQQTQDENWDAIKKKVRIITKNVAIDKNSVKTGLELLGVWYEGRIKNQIRHGNFVPNAPSTIATKKSSKPLIDTTQMRNSITHIVKVRGL